MRVIAFTVVAAIACAQRAAQSPVPQTNVTSARSFAVPSAECYALAYSDPQGGGSEELFPAWLVLIAGRDSGQADGRRIPGFAYYRKWRQTLLDSLRIDFTGSFEGLTIRARRADSNLTGRAIWLSDIIGGPVPSMGVVGTREACPAEFQSAK
ncbi:MAG TPA: hypothetical protein VJ840_15410 [Gemmatimonadaceae bacterium]|nr:hypothetical protein [Gemmatimonadaceae bacterium]